MRDGSNRMVKFFPNIPKTCPANNFKNIETVKVIVRSRRRRNNLLQASENSNFRKMRLLSGVYPRVKHGAGSEALEGLAMTSYGGL
jgi:hypothetical protein